MSYKKTSYVFLALLIVLGVAYLISAINLSTGTETIGPHFFPIILSILLIILCVISFVQTVKKEDEKISVKNIKLNGLIVLLTVVFIISWKTFGFFYINALLFMYITLMVLTKNVQPKLTKKIYLVNLGFSVLIILILYIIFDFLLSIK